MKKYIGLVIIAGLMLSFSLARAEDNTTSDDSANRSGGYNVKKAEGTKRQTLMDELKNKREAFREEMKTKRETFVAGLKTEREAFLAKLKARKE